MQVTPRPLGEVLSATIHCSGFKAREEETVSEDRARRSFAERKNGNWATVKGDMGKFNNVSFCSICVCS